MSISLYWKPVDPSDGHYIDGSGSFANALIKAFYEFPIELHEIDVAKLEGIEACGYGGAREIIEAINCNPSGVTIDARY